MSAKQIRTHTPRWFITTIAHSGAKMGQYINGFHHWFAQIFGKGLHICGSGYIE